MSEADFYARIPPFDEFRRVVDPGAYRPVPDSWYVVLSDVRGSTKAIEEGRYKDVNVLGACSIAAVRNAVRPHEIAFVFGGDGATFVVPAEALPAAICALRGTRKMGRTTFDLDLRVGAVPVVDLRRAGHELHVARYRLGTNSLAMLRGGGQIAAESWIKSASPGSPYIIEDDLSEPDVDFSGFECRWDPVMSKRGEMVSLLVLATSQASAELTYARVLGEIERCLGTGGGSPVSTAQMSSRWPAHQARLEISVQSFGKGLRRRLSYVLRVHLQMMIFHISRFFGLRIGTFEASRYLTEMVTQTDFRKFDDMLRTIVDCSRLEREQITAFLDREMAQGELIYGLHVADRALMTCLVQTLQDHLHFIDGADGGYAMAAKQLKSRMARLSTSA